MLRAMRSYPDRCPGVVRLHQADDGALARVRVPAGLLRGDQARVILGIATELGDGAIDVTSRGNIQLRGLSPDAAPELSDRLCAAGLLPSIAHERARNIVASPLAGLDNGGSSGGPHDGHHGEVQSWARDLDRLVCATPALAALSGRFLFGLDDGRGDIVGLRPDVTLVAGPDGRADLLLAGERAGIRVRSADAPAAAATAARLFLDVRAGAGSNAWRVSELGPARATLLDALLSALPVRGGDTDTGLVTTGPRADLAPSAAAPGLGLLRRSDGICTISVGLRLGRATAEQWTALVQVAESTQVGHGLGELRLTPWRGVVIPGLSEETAREHLARLGAAGLLTSDGSPWASATACTGRPGCAKALADVRADAHAALAGLATELPAIPRLLPVHWSGCERRCGRPATRHLNVVADETGYLVNDSASQADPRKVTHDELAAATSAGRRAM